MLITFTQEQPLYRQIYDSFREKIARGELQPGQKIPSSRELASQLGISRSSVIEAYDQLISEGYLETRHGSGTFINPAMDNAVEPSSSKQQKPARSTTKLSQSSPQLSEAAKQVDRQLPGIFFNPPNLEKYPIRFSFQAGRTHTDPRSEKIWQQLIKESAKQGIEQPTPNQGNLALRQALAEHLRQVRNCHCSADNIVITNGSQQAFDILGRLFLNPGDTVAVEEPGYFGAKAAFAGNHGKLAYIKTDLQGIDISQLENKASGAKLVYVTPSHQFPRGSVLPRERRLALLEWANSENAFIIEDDYDSEFRYTGKPLESIQSIDPYGRTLYVGTFSKLVSPALRIGYVVLPENLIQPFLRVRWAMDVKTPPLQQTALAQWLQEGHHRRHIRRLQKIYHGRRNALVQSLNKHFSHDEVTIEGSSTGLHIFVSLKQVAHSQLAALLEDLTHSGIAVTSSDFFYHRSPKQCCFILGFSSIPESQIDPGIKQLAKLARKHAKR
ncbi:MAG: PLP-dependent aminotransferase family protein [Cellvibrionaceae bacterium]